jgi:hypothetical protein
MRWTLLEAEMDAYFVTCDNPVMLTRLPRPIPRPAWDQGVGFSEPDACVTFPLAPRLCLFACRVAEAPERMVAPRADVHELNRIRAASAERFLYSDRESTDVAELARMFPDPPPMIDTSGLGQDADFAAVKVRRRRTAPKR